MLIHQRELKARWERFVEFGNPLEQYRAIQFADMTVYAEHKTDFDTDFMLKILDKIKSYESGKLVVTFMDDAEIDCVGE